MKKKVHKLIIAVIQLETAIKLFLDDKNYIPAATLAGASEEILGKIITRKGELNAFDILSVDLQQRYKITLNKDISKKEISDTLLNLHRNELKHFNNPDVAYVEADYEFESVYLISRTIVNLLTLNIITENITRFNKWQDEQPTTN